MTKHSQKHDHGHHHEHESHVQKQPPHKDWRLWIVVGLMLAAMLGYIFSMDEEIEPGGVEAEQRMPADAP